MKRIRKFFFEMFFSHYCFEHRVKKNLIGYDYGMSPFDMVCDPIMECPVCATMGRERMKRN